MRRRTPHSFSLDSLPRYAPAAGPGATGRLHLTFATPNDRLPPSAPADGDHPTLDASAARAALREALARPPAGRIPGSTYRLQFGAGFGFAEATRRLAYLERLGVSDLYASPYLAARSAHGYDVQDHACVNPNLGGEEAFEAMLAELARLGLGQVADVVPNHMGIAGGGNAWWNDVLENGPASPHAAYFDIDWAPLKTEMRGQVLLPTLGDQYGRVLERGELRLSLEGGALALHYFDLRLPVAPGTYEPVLELALERLAAALAGDGATDPAADPAAVELESILTAVRHLPRRDVTDAGAQRERQREKEVIKRRIQELGERSFEALAALEGAVEEFNGRAGDPRSFDRLDVLIARQPYRLAYWRVAGEEINYRRFFDVNELAGIRVERPEVFRDTHRLVLDLVARGAVTGLRVDHPDGLWDPAGYFVRVQVGATVARARLALEAGRGSLSEAELATLEAEADALAPEIARARPLYLLAEKIVAAGETLPPSWAIHGTTGYEFLNHCYGLFVDPAGARATTETYARFVGPRPRYEETVHAAKTQVLETALASELNVLADALNRLSERDRRSRDFTLGALSRALRETIAAFPVYRSYVDETTERPTDHDRAAVEAAVRLAKRRSAGLDTSVLDFLRSLLLLEPVEGLDERERRDFVMRFQQLSGPVMAKGLEDTTFYVFNRLVALNEVGGDPNVFGTSPPAFHRHQVERAQSWPHAMLASTTHDTKRSEDVRARIAVLSELTHDWRALLGRLARLGRSRRASVEGRPAPDRNDEILLYQTLLGAWPFEALEGSAPLAESFVERIVAYMAKASREAKVNTSWVSPNAAYDAALERFTRESLEDGRVREALEPLARAVARHGALNSLAAVAIRYTSPGVPDLYQGNEGWDLSLVDPDNRRPVDFERLDAQLEGLRARLAAGDAAALAAETLDSWPDGRVKLLLTHRLLEHRRRYPWLHERGEYRPLEPTGPAGEHLVAFARCLDGREIITLVPRLVARLGALAPDGPLLPDAGLWAGTNVLCRPGRYRDVVTGAAIDAVAGLDAGAALATFPVAVMELEEPS